VTILGYHVLPEQTAPGQARMQYEEQAQDKLDDVREMFADAGSQTDTRLVFTHDEEQTMNRIADEVGAEAILIPNPAHDVERVLVPLRGEVDVHRVAAFVASMIGDRDVDVTLYHVTPDEQVVEQGKTLLEAAADRLHEAGIPAAAITQDREISETPVKAMAAKATAHDAVVIGESEPSLQTFLFGDPSKQIARQSLGPVVVVRRADVVEEAA
jgi:nucleotide-binding universal stress UspA family protein